MEVILRKTVDKVGRAGEVVKVKDGYARNYLLPQQLAYVATEGAKRRMQNERKQIQQQLELERSEAEALATTLAALTMEFTAKTGDGDRLFGSITTADISAKLAEAGHQMDKRVIELNEPIKVIGEHQVFVRLHPDVRAQLNVVVKKEE